MSALSSFRRRLMVGAYPKEQPNYLCFEALESGTFTLTIGSYLSTTNYSYVEYSTDDGATWVKTNNVNSTTITVTTPSISTGGKVLWRGVGLRMSQSNSGADARCCVFSATCNYNVSGLLMSLFYGKNVTENSTLSSTYSCPRLFNGDTHIIDASGLIMPSNTKQYCYDFMFQNCTNLKKAPQLPATSLEIYCYRSLFSGCTKLTDAPELQALVLSGNCYYQMFNNNYALMYLKMLATDISAYNCLYQWVNGVTNTSDFIFVKNINATWTTSGISGTRPNWTIIYYDPALDKYYLDQQRSQECDDHGNPI